MILLAGSFQDPNIRSLISAGRTMHADLVLFVTDGKASPSFHWDLDNNVLCQEGKKIDARAAFIRRDVFHASTKEDNLKSWHWYSSLAGYLKAHSNINVFNRKYLLTNPCKPNTLLLSKKYGISTPKTIITNDRKKLLELDEKTFIAKPVSGGGFCHTLNKVLTKTDFTNGKAANPAIVQEKINGPDIRIYRIGNHFQAFRIASDAVDYRQANKVSIILYNQVPQVLLRQLKLLMDEIEMNWGAADFKYSLARNKYYLLEINSNPMFSEFDKICRGLISKNIINYFLNK